MNKEETKNIISIKEISRGWLDSLFSSHINFEDKRENERIIVFTRRHWFVLLTTVAGGFLMSLLPFVLVILGAEILVQYNLSAIFTLFWSLYIMSVWYFIFYQLTMYVLDTWIVTNQRVIDIMQIRFFSRKVSELNLESIQDISVNTTGIIQSYFNFGNVEIQTAAAAQRFLFEEVPHPLDIKDKIMEAANDIENTSIYEIKK
jgi:signal transduction histidine kinase